MFCLVDCFEFVWFVFIDVVLFICNCFVDVCLVDCFFVCCFVCFWFTVSMIVVCLVYWFDWLLLCLLFVLIGIWYLTLFCVGLAWLFESVFCSLIDVVICLVWLSVWVVVLVDSGLGVDRMVCYFVACICGLWVD